MTQPSLATTFDTSLMEYQTPSTTLLDADKSLPSPPPTVQAPQPQKPFRDLPTTQAYDAWASTYDSDGNILQAIDDLQLASGLLNDVLALCPVSGGDADGVREAVLLDLGCGTGRNTQKLLRAAMTTDVTRATRVTVRGIDASAAMLEIARGKCEDLLSSLHQSRQGTDTPNSTAPVAKLDLRCLDFLTPPFPPSYAAKPDLVLCTLVLEHAPLPAFFSLLSSTLKPGGVALVTNMHPDMGAVTQAGFVNDQGERVRGRSWVHGVQETVDAARREGFEVLEVREGEVEREMVEKGLVGKRGKKWVGRRVWFALVVRKGVMGE